MSVIDLGDAAPWSPPEGPPRGSRPARVWRRVAAVAVGVLAAALLAGAAPSPGAPLFTLEDRVLDVRLGAGMVFVTRYQFSGLGLFEGRAPTGRLLWTRPRERDTEGLLFSAAGTLVVSSVYGDIEARDGNVTVLDAGTGAELWRRGAVAAVGHSGGRMVLEDVSGQADQYSRNRPGTETRLLGVDARTGATAWERTLPAGSLVSYDEDAASGEMVSIDELTAGGTVVRHDPGDGAETARWPLEASTAEATGLSIYGDRAVVRRIGFQGPDVYDLASGRRLWHYDKDSSSVFPCAAGRWCAVGGDGIHALDPATGRAEWGIEQYNDVFGWDGDLLVAGGLGTSVSLSHDNVVFAVDARTGAIARRLDGWIATYERVGDRQVVAHTEPGGWAGVIGLYDPRTGGVRIFGRGLLGPTPRCSAGSGIVACTGNGLSVWRLP